MTMDPAKKERLTVFDPFDPADHGSTIVEHLQINPAHRIPLINPHGCIKANPRIKQKQIVEKLNESQVQYFVTLKVTATIPIYVVWG